MKLNKILIYIFNENFYHVVKNEKNDHTKIIIVKLQY